MATSTCMKCGKTQFEVKECTPRGSSSKIQFVQCTNCGGVIGVMDFYDIGGALHQLDDKLNALLKR